MSNQYPDQPEATNSYDGPTDDELKRIEKELDDLKDPLIQEAQKLLLNCLM